MTKNVNKITVLSLFDGISCGYQALKEAGVNVGKYYASEIDKYAISAAMKNHPDIIQLGDVTKWREWDIDWSSIDLLIGGSPCTGFSNAGKKQNFDDPQSKLIFYYFEILNHIKSVNPSVKFLLENVKMRNEWLDIIDQYIGLKRTIINSELFSAQSRPRAYWTNLKISELPTPSEAVINDILEDGADENEKLYLSKVHLAAFHRSYKFKPDKRTEKSRTITKSYYSRPYNVPYIPHNNSNAAEEYSEYRMFSPIECERLQTLPDNYTAFGADGKEISNSRRYEMIGNGWTVAVIKFLFSELVQEQSNENCRAAEVPIQVLNEEVGIEEVPVPSETELLEQMAEAPLDESKPLQVGMFTDKSFNQVLADALKKGKLEKLFDEFWFEGETCCLYGDSNVGKSILAVQIARNIANSRKVLYFDFELSDYQILGRYYDEKTNKCYRFPENLHHISFNYMMGAYSVEELPEQIINQMESLVKKTGASVIIIDNLTWIAYNSRSAKMAGELMRRLSAMKSHCNLSMLILAHTPKRNMSKPITQNDLGGSKMIMNFLDSAFAMGCSAKDPAYRYIKQIKTRYVEKKYGEDNVWLCEIQSVRSFLMLQRVGFAMESEHLKKLKDGDKEALIAKIKVMKASGKSIREIAAELGMSPATVDRYSKK